MERQQASIKPSPNP